MEIRECGNSHTPRKELKNKCGTSLSHLHIFTFDCGQGWIRTTELRRGQIYSLLPLATWLLAHF
jgi:hypothetical protein